MAYEVPPLPYDYAALEPHIDEQTMQLHHDKHHQAYVDKANGALEGTEWADKPIEEVIANLDSLPDDKKGPVRNNGGGHQPLAVLGVDEPGRRRRALRRPRERDRRRLRLVRRLQGEVRGGRRRPVRLRLGLARARRRLADDHQHPQPGQPGHRVARRRCWATTSGSTPTT